MSVLEKVPEYILNNVFTRKDFTVIDNGKKINTFIHWVECKQVETPLGKVGGGYIVVYPDGEQHHMYEHPDDVFRDDKEAAPVEAKPMFVDDPKGSSICAADPESIINKNE